MHRIRGKEQPYILPLWVVMRKQSNFCWRREPTWKLKINMARLHFGLPLRVVMRKPSNFCWRREPTWKLNITMAGLHFGLPLRVVMRKRYKYTYINITHVLLDCGFSTKGMQIGWLPKVIKSNLDWINDPDEKLSKSIFFEHISSHTQISHVFTLNLHQIDFRSHQSYYNVNI